MNKLDELYTKEQCEEAVKKSFSIAGMLKELKLIPCGGNYITAKRLIELYNLDTSHFTGSAWNQGENFIKIKETKPLSEILKENSFYSSYKLKNRLIQEGYKEYRCEKCKRTEWEGEAIPLELHHINGIHDDNRLENIQILCPNCHAQTENYRGKKISNKKENKSQKEKINPKVKQPKKRVDRFLDNNLIDNIYNLYINEKMDIINISEALNISVNKTLLGIQKKRNKLFTEDYLSKLFEEKGINDVCEYLRINKSNLMQYLIRLNLENVINKYFYNKEMILGLFQLHKSFVQVGKILGYSDKGLKKICKRLNILDEIEKIT